MTSSNAIDARVSLQNEELRHEHVFEYEADGAPGWDKKCPARRMRMIRFIRFDSIIGGGAKIAAGRGKQVKIGKKEDEPAITSHSSLLYALLGSAAHVTIII